MVKIIIIKERIEKDMKTLKLLKLTPHAELEEIEIEDSLEALQKEVEGYIEQIGIDERHALIVNEEGKIEGLSLSLILQNENKEKEYIVGNVLFCRIKNHKIASLTENEIKALKMNPRLNIFRILDV